METQTDLTNTRIHMNIRPTKWLEMDKSAGLQYDTTQNKMAELTEVFAHNTNDIWDRKMVVYMSRP